MIGKTMMWQSLYWMSSKLCLEISFDFECVFFEIYKLTGYKKKIVFLVSVIDLFIL